MDNLKSKVVSLELAKRMKELGWKKRTIFCWCIKDLFEDDGIQVIIKPTEIAKESGCTRTMMSPLFCEIWEELPEQIECKPEGRKEEFYTKHIDEDNIVDYKSLVYCCLQCREISEYDKVKANPIQENAGELWCWLREKGYIKGE